MKGLDIRLNDLCCSNLRDNVDCLATVSCKKAYTYIFYQNVNNM